MPKEKKPTDEVIVFISKSDVFEQLDQQYVVYQINDKTYRVPIGKMVKVSRKLAEMMKQSGDIEEYTEL